MEHRWNEIYRGKPKYLGKKPLPVPLCPPKIPHGLTRDRTRASAGLPPRRSGFDPRSVHVGFLVDKVALGEVFSPSTSVFASQFHSTGAPLLGKDKK
jgi:hypothetical protein